MISYDFDYCKPDSLSELLQVLASEPKVTLLAGGHALLLSMKLREIRPRLLVDISALPELSGIRRKADEVEIGAMVTSAQIEQSSMLQDSLPLFPKAAKLISDPLIRNRATIGGSLAQADPLGDWPAVALAVAATVHLMSPQGERAVSIDDFFQANDLPHPPGNADGRRTVLGRAEVITKVSAPLLGGDVRQCYVKRMHPASGFALLGVAVCLRLDENRRCDWCRIGVTGAAGSAFRASEAEKVLLGQMLSDAIVEEASMAAVSRSIEFVGDSFGSPAYRRQLLPVYVRRALQGAIDPARVSGHDEI